MQKINTHLDATCNLLEKFAHFDLNKSERFYYYLLEE